MHIMEGYLPHPWWEIWLVVSFVIVAYGVYRLSSLTKRLPEAKPLLALMGAFIFILSALKLPSVTHLFLSEATELLSWVPMAQEKQLFYTI